MAHSLCNESAGDHVLRSASMAREWWAVMRVVHLQCGMKPRLINPVMREIAQWPCRFAAFMFFQLPLSVLPRT